jgi:hypothetical protein
MLALLPLVIAATRARQEPRPEQVTVALLLLFVAVFENARAGGRDRTAWLVLPEILWANMHPGWILGPAIALTYAASEFWSPSAIGRPRRWILTGCLLFLAGALTPRPLDTLSLRMLRDLLNPSIAWVDELRRWSWAQDRTQPITIWLVLALAAFLQGGRTVWRASPAIVLLSVAGLVASVLSARYRALGVLLSYPALATCLNEKRTARILASAAGLLGVAALARDWRSYAPGPGVVEMAVPIRATALADSLRLSGPVLNTPWYGGYVLWVRGDTHPPLTDTRNLGGPRFQFLLSRAFHEPGAFDTLESMWPFTHAILQPPGDTPDRMAILLAADPNWALVFIDDAGLLFVNRSRVSHAMSAVAYTQVSPDYTVMAERSRAALQDPGLERTLRAELERARRESPWHARTSLWLGLLDLAEARTQPAIAELDEVERIAPLTPGLALRQGMAYELAGDRNRARKAYQRALHDPEDVTAAREAIERLQ